MDAMRDTLPSILVSYAYRSSWAKRKRVAWREVVLDSGAYTAFKVGTPVDLVAFGDWALEELADPLVTEVFTLDVIGGSWRESLRNTEALHARGIPAIPVFHVGEPTDVLVALARDYPKIALGGAVGYHAKAAWAALCFKTVWPKKIHGLGFGTNALDRLPFHTVDSSTWTIGPHKFCQYESFGGIRLPLRGRTAGHSISGEIAHELDREARYRRFWDGRLPEDFGRAPSVRLALTTGQPYKSIEEYAAEHQP